MPDDQQKVYQGGDLRAAMPEVTAWIDDMRAAFGATVVNGQIRKGIAGEPVFFASENGQTVGTQRPWPPAAGEVITPDEYLARVKYPDGLPEEVLCPKK